MKEEERRKKERKEISLDGGLLVPYPPPARLFSSWIPDERNGRSVECQVLDRLRGRITLHLAWRRRKRRTSSDDAGVVGSCIAFVLDLKQWCVS